MPPFGFKPLDGGFAACALVCALAGPATASSLQVIYPGSGHTTDADRISIIGTASPDGVVTVNGRAVQRSPAGHFAPVVPLKLGRNVIVLRHGAETLRLVVDRVPDEPLPAPDGAFAPGSISPGSMEWRMPGESIRLSAIAPPGAQVAAHWKGRTIPMLPESPVTLPGNKAGLIDRNEPRLHPDVTRYVGTLVLGGPTAASPPSFTLDGHGRHAIATAPGAIGVIDPARLPVVRVTSDSGVARIGPSTDYARLTPLPAGTTSAVTGRDGDWLRLSYGGWIRQQETARVEAPPPETTVRSVIATSTDRWTELRVPMEAAVPVTVDQPDGEFVLTLHGAVSQTDIARCEPDGLVDRLDMRPAGPTTTRFAFKLKRPYAWGYRLRYQGTTLVLDLHHWPLRAPGGPLAGMTIVLDPGHGGSDTGTSGPTGWHEKAQTLIEALLVRDELARRGAHVVMTRDQDRDVSLADRDALIERVAPDLSVSLHYNALPDGGDCGHTEGVAGFWYNPQSHDLAMDLQEYLVDTLHRPSYGIYWDNLALTRPAVAPAVLMELGFMTHPWEFEWITDESANRKLAIAIADGLQRWWDAVTEPPASPTR